MVSSVIEIGWSAVQSGSTEACRVVETATGIEVTSMISGGGVDCRYTLTADAGWNFATLVLEHAGRRLDVGFDGADWTVDGQQRPDLADAREVDLSVSPLTNTLPIRRLGLKIGESADLTTAYAVPDLDVVPDPQRYTRLSELVYRYESRDSDFRRDVTVDADGLVVSYPGLFDRA